MPNISAGLAVNKHLVRIRLPENALHLIHKITSFRFEYIYRLAVKLMLIRNLFDKCENLQRRIFITLKE